jgi:hypothetical protein
MPTHNFSYVWSRNGETISNVVAVTSDGEHNFDVSLTSEQVHKQLDIALDVSELKAIVISTTVDITLKTNDSGTPIQTLTIEAGEPLIWQVESGLTNPLTTDVTAMYFTNGEATTGTVKLRFLEDATP